MTLHHEVTGTGPPLLLIQGGAAEAGAARMLVDELAVTHRVITYDRRGIGRSPAGDVPRTLDGHADDAASLLTDTGPAAVVGVSIGAVIGLRLAVRHPQRVATLIAHEPPLPALVRDDDRAAALDRVERLVARDEFLPALRLMAELTTGGDPVEPGYRPEPPETDPEAGLRHFLRHDVPAVRSARIDPDEVTASGVRVVPTGGLESRGRWEHHCAEVLAARIGRGLVELPGGHDGPVTHPVAGAAALRGLVGGT